MLARWWLVLQAEVKSLCGHRKGGSEGVRAASHSALSLPTATQALRGKDRSLAPWSQADRGAGSHRF